MEIKITSKSLVYTLNAPVWPQKFLFWLCDIYILMCDIYVIYQLSSCSLLSKLPDELSSTKIVSVGLDHFNAMIKSQKYTYTSIHTENGRSQFSLCNLERVQY